MPGLSCAATSGPPAVTLVLNGIGGSLTGKITQSQKCRPTAAFLDGPAVNDATAGRGRIGIGGGSTNKVLLVRLE